MAIPTSAKTHIVAHLQTLSDLEIGKAVFYCMVRPGGEKDTNVRVSFGESESVTTLDFFARLWKQDEGVKSTKREDWVVARGALVRGKDRLRALPGVRANRVTAKAQLKDTFKALRTSLKGEGVAIKALDDVVDGEFGTTGQYTTWVRTAGVVAEGQLDETETEAGKDTSSKLVIALVNAFKKVGLNAALRAHASTNDEPARTLAGEALAKLAKVLEKLVADSVDARRTLVGSRLGKTRYKDSLLTLDDLDARLRLAQNEVQKALGLTFEGADLTRLSDVKNTDIILRTLRALLAKYRDALPDAKVGVLAELYFAADYWLKAAGVGQAGRKFSDGVDKEMKAQVEEFYTKAATRLAKEAKVGINALPAWLEKHYGKGMEAHGTELDVQRELAKWMTGDQRDLFRVHVKGGKLYQYDWWTWREKVPGLMNLVPADSSEYPSEAITAGFTGFVLSMSGDLYITHQHAVEQENGDQLSVFHSSYMSGLPIRMAGELKISGGKVEIVNSRSGHYKPPLAMFVNFIKHMMMLGVKIESVMPDPKKKDKLTVGKFLELHGSLEPSPADFEKNDREMSAYRQKIQFEQMVAADQRAYDEAIRGMKLLAGAVANDLKNRSKVAMGGAGVETFNQGLRLAAAVKRAATEVERVSADLEERSRKIKAQLAQRKKNHDALVTKDVTAQAEVADPYVIALTAMRTKLDGLVVRGKTAVEKARRPRSKGLPKA